MFPYTVKYTESEYDIQSINLLYKIHQQSQDTFEPVDVFDIFEKKKSHKIQIMYLVII